MNCKGRIVSIIALASTLALAACDPGVDPLVDEPQPGPVPPGISQWEGDSVEPRPALQGPGERVPQAPHQSDPDLLSPTPQPPAPYGTCEAATTLTLPAAGSVVVKGTLKGAVNEFEKISCGTGEAFLGPQVYYRFKASAGTRYRVRLQPSAALDRAVLYAYSGDSCEEDLIDQACSSNDQSGGVVTFDQAEEALAISKISESGAAPGEMKSRGVFTDGGCLNSSCGGNSGGGSTPPPPPPPADPPTVLELSMELESEAGVLTVVVDSVAKLAAGSFVLSIEELE